MNELRHRMSTMDETVARLSHLLSGVMIGNPALGNGPQDARKRKLTSSSTTSESSPGGYDHSLSMDAYDRPLHNGATNGGDRCANHSLKYNPPPTNNSAS